MTSSFTKEIGPAHDRPSAKLYEKWVKSAGGSIRGGKKQNDIAVVGENAITVGIDKIADTSENEVIQLKYLQKSNQDQMTKLHKLWLTEPLCIHYYLRKIIFPAYMRSQHTKISASGQAIGGDLLVGKRVGFSGTPSDLLPLELNQCDYARGDDGKMLTTVLNEEIVSCTHIEEGWTAQSLIEKIATANNPQFHSLIDTGALITCYTNKQVAQQLLKKGLKWCDGVVFLDDRDRQQVLVRATGRVVNADQCGVPLRKDLLFTIKYTLAWI